MTIFQKMNFFKILTFFQMRTFSKNLNLNIKRNSLKKECKVIKKNKKELKKNIKNKTVKGKRPK